MHHISEKYHAEIGLSTCQMIFHSLEFRMRKPRPVIARGDPEKQDTFKKFSEDLKRGDTDIWTLDECHFYQHGTSLALWIPPEDKDPSVLQYPTRKGMSVFGAVNIRTGEFAGMMCPTL